MYLLTCLREREREEKSKRIIVGTAKEIWKKRWLQVTHNMCLKKWSQVGTCSAKLFAINPSSTKLEKQFFS